MGIASKIGAFFTGGAMEVAGKGADIVERWKPGETKKHEMAMDVDNAIAAGVDSARAHDADTYSAGNIVDTLVNAVNRSIRPGVTILLLGGVFGWWELPAPAAVDPFYFAMTEKALLFWFGGRALLKDLPSAVKYLRAMRQG